MLVILSLDDHDFIGTNQVSARGLVSRSGWLEGPWDEEPDFVGWYYKRFPCLAIRNGIGTLCGYVGVDKRHPYYCVDFVDDELHQFSVHGGVTRVGFIGPIWCIGFDTVHAFDKAPKVGLVNGATYRTLEYVMNQTEQLADQLRRCIGH